MLSDDSDLTELSSSGDDYAKPTKKSQASKKPAYRLRNVLKPGRTTQYTAKALYDQIHDGDIDLDPEYQRDIVWSDVKQIGLIDSIFRNFYVPPIIFAVTTEDDGTEKRVCIDGKQRLTSIQKFIGGLIPHRDPFTNERLWFVDSKTGTKRKLLPQQYKNLFQNKQIVCIEYSDLPPDFEREVFQRVQMGMALTTAEKMQAISGPWPDFVREINKQYYMGKDGIAGNMDMDKNRARDFQNLAQTIYCIDQLPEQVQSTTLQIEKWLAKEDGPSEVTQRKIHDVFRIYKELANHKQLKAPFKRPSRLAPAEFIMSGVLIAMHKENLSLPQLSQAIGLLRAETRAVHDDVRTNGKVFKTMFNVISKLKASALKDTPGQPTASTGSKSGKRKRNEVSDEGSSGDEGGNDEAEYRPKTSKTRVLSSQATSRPNPASAKPPTNLSNVSRVKIEESRPTIPPATPIQPPGTMSRPLPTGPSGLARIQAAKDNAASTLNGTWSGLQHPTPPNSTRADHSVPPPQHPPVSLPPRPGVPPNTYLNSSIEAVMMRPSAQPTYPPPPYPTPPFPATAPTHHVAQNGSQGPIGIPIPIPSNGSDGYQSGSNAYHQNSDGYQSHSAGASRSGYPTQDDYRRAGSPRLSRDERSDGSGYRGGRGYEERRGREVDRGYGERSKDRERDREKEIDRDGNRDREREPSRSHSSYSGRGESYYKSRDHGWDRRTDKDGRDFRRGSGYKER